MNAERLIDKYLEITKTSNFPKTLAQKQGARKGARKRARRLYTGDESSEGYLTYYYYHPLFKDRDSLL